MNTEVIWNTYNKDVEALIFSKIKDRDITNDLVQEVFVKVHTKMNDLKDVQKVKPWILSIARNTMYDYFRSNKLIAIEEFDVVEEVVIEPKSHTEKDCLPGIIKNLPKKYRQPLFLSDIKGIKQTEIAKQLKLPLSTVKSQIQRARKMIAQGYMDCCDYKLNDEGYLVGVVKDKENCKVCH